MHLLIYCSIVLFPPHHSSELGSTPRRLLALSVLHQLLDCLQWQVLLESKWLDDGAGLRDDVVLNQPLVGVLRVPLLADGHAHQCIELLGAAVLVRELFHPVLLRKLLVSFLCLIDLHSLHLGVLSLLFHCFDLLRAYLFGSGFPLLVSARVDAFPSPLIPSLLDDFGGDLLAEVAFNVFFLFFLEVIQCVVILRHEERLQHLLFIGFRRVGGVFDQLRLVRVECLQV